jgi:hypothetical protein
VEILYGMRESNATNKRSLNVYDDDSHPTVNQFEQDERHAAAGYNEKRITSSIHSFIQSSCVVAKEKAIQNMHTVIIIIIIIIITLTGSCRVFGQDILAHRYQCVYDRHLVIMFVLLSSCCVEGVAAFGCYCCCCCFLLMCVCCFFVLVLDSTRPSKNFSHM